MSNDREKLVEALTCPCDCSECDKTNERCRIEIRMLINLLLRDKKNTKEEHNNKVKDMNSMVS